MDWIIYIIFGFLYWKQFPLFSWVVFTVILAAICWYVRCDTARNEDTDKEMSVKQGGDEHDI